MKENAPKPTSLARPDAPGLTLAQQSAVDLLAVGKNDTEAAELLKLNRVTVTRWRLYSPEFRATLAIRRADIWGAAAARLQSLIPKAVDALAEALDNAEPAERATLAITVLKLAGPLPPPRFGSIDPEDYVRDEVNEERGRKRHPHDELMDTTRGLPSYEEHADEVRKRLAALSAPDPDPGAVAPTLNGPGEPR